VWPRRLVVGAGAQALAGGLIVLLVVVAAPPDLYPGILLLAAWGAIGIAAAWAHLRGIGTARTVSVVFSLMTAALGGLCFYFYLEPFDDWPTGSDLAVWLTIGAITLAGWISTWALGFLTRVLENI